MGLLELYFQLFTVDLTIPIIPYSTVFIRIVSVWLPYYTRTLGFCEIYSNAEGCDDEYEVIEACEALGLELDITVYLEGPFNGTTMNTGLSLPLSQPYNTAPWNYSGTESVSSVPPNVVDWVLIELRDATSASAATEATIVAQQAAFLLNDGSVVDIDGSSNPVSHVSISNNLYVVIWHRNHLGIMSANALTDAGGIYSYNFTTPEGQAYGTDAQKNLGASNYGMYAGDGNADRTISETDRTSVWNTDAGKSGYLNGDYNMDTQEDNPDKNSFWFINFGKSCQVPLSK